jgi:hypothetical protein
LLDLVRRRHSLRWWSSYRLSVELYVIILSAIVLLPTDIDSRQLHRMGFVSIGFLSERLTTVLAVLVCCVLGAIKPQKWQLLGFSAIAVVFFGCLYGDTGAINRMEDQLDSLVRNLPPGERVVGTIETFSSTNVGGAHIIDRACIEHCFSYDNYEPKVAQFRVRANFGNRFVMTNRPTISDGPFDDYIVQSRDLPLIQIDPCSPGAAALCVRALGAGDKTAVGSKLDRAWVGRYSRTALLVDLLLACFLAICVFVGQLVFTGHHQQAEF